MTKYCLFFTTQKKTHCFFIFTHAPSITAIQTHLHMFNHTLTHSHTHIHKCTQSHTHTHTHTQMHAVSLIQTNTHTHTLTNTHTHLSNSIYLLPAELSRWHLSDKRTLMFTFFVDVNKFESYVSNQLKIS